MCFFLAPIGLPSMRTSSPAATWVPSTAVTPLQLTRPCSIHLSASRREHTPVSLMYLLSLTGRGSHPPLAAAQQDPIRIDRRDTSMHRSGARAGAAAGTARRLEARPGEPGQAGPSPFRLRP